MNTNPLFKSLFLVIGISILFVAKLGAQEELPLWPNGITNNPVQYAAEKTRVTEARKSSLIQQSRNYSCVSVPTYTLIKPEHPNGVGIVICPGGGFREVCFDREGTDFALFLAKFGITSMVLKYRTFNLDALTSNLKYEEYIYHVYADAKQAIYMLRKQAKELGLDTARIGIGGFSAGGALAIGTIIEMGDDNLPEYANYLKYNSLPSFACPVYPGIHPDFITKTGNCNYIPPVFLVNGNEDNKTPAKICLDFYAALQKKNVKAELHIYAKGGHGFDSGLERGYGISMWRDSFIAWLKDMDFITQ